MRSVLHYAGREGCGKVLEHLRRQAELGERFVHQTVCFAEPRDADCLNALYEGMKSGKWFPTAGRLRRLLDASGWKIRFEITAPPVKLDSEDLARRYQLGKAACEAIRTSLSERFGEKDGIFRLTPVGFTACLHYRIWTCEAA